MTEKLNGVIKLFVGLILIIVGLFALASWWNDFLVMLRGVVGVVVGMIGLIFLLIGFSDMKD